MRMIKFSTLSERDILALAISLEEEHERMYADFAERLRDDFPCSARLFDAMKIEESLHRRRLIDLYQYKFGDHIPLIRRQDVRGFVHLRPIWLVRPLRLQAVRAQVSTIEQETRKFYEKAAGLTKDAAIRQLLDDLAQEERAHEAYARELRDNELSLDITHEEETSRRLLLLQVIQPALAGLMDGSISTLAPLFAAAIATRNSWDAFLVGSAASLGAGISMGFAEGLSDDGNLTMRGHPWIRGSICGLATALGAIGHTLPFLISRFDAAIGIALIVVMIELGVITGIRHRYMNTPIASAAMQVGIGGTLVFVTGILIGRL